MNDHDRWSEDVTAYALGALDADGAAELERHAESCERCRSEIRWLVPAVDGLAEAVPRLEPPPQLRERLVAEVQADARAAGTDRADAEPGGLRARLGGLRLGSLTWKPLAGLAAVVLVIAGIAGYVIGSSGSSSGAHTYTAAEAEAGITAEVVREDGAAELTLAHVVKLPPDKVLEAWVQREGTVEPVKALFVPDRDGNASTTIADMRGVEVVMVTREPAGGSPEPTSEPFITVPIKG